MASGVFGGGGKGAFPKNAKKNIKKKTLNLKNDVF